MKQKKIRRVSELTEFARLRRRHATGTEQRLWTTLRGRRLAGLKFRREVPLQGYLADFYCDEHRLIVEVDGSVHAESGVAARDAIRQQHLEQAGYRVLRFTGDQVIGCLGWVTDEIQRACGLDPKSPSPARRERDLG